MAPAKFVQGGTANESIVAAGSLIAGAHVRSSVIAHDVQIREGALVEESVLCSGVRVGPNAVLRRVILDKNVIVPEGAVIGVDLDRDRELYTVSDGGVVVLGKGEQVR